MSWNLPQKWVKSMYLNEIVLTAYCNNPFIWTAKDNRYVDPESSTSVDSGDVGYGFGELYTNPSCRTYGLNLKVTF